MSPPPTSPTPAGNAEPVPAPAKPSTRPAPPTSPKPGRNGIVVEICVSDVPSALAAEAAGADRLELCADLGQGGTTPSLGTIDVALRTLRHAAVRVMVRPRGGDFRISEVERRVMLADIAAIRGLANPHGLAVGVVVGALTTDEELDLPILKELIGAAGPLPVTVHKAFDEIDDQLTALEQIIDLGADAVLTSGGAASALEGAARIAVLRERAAGRLRVIAAGGIRSHNIGQVLTATRATEIHLRAPIQQQGREATDPDEVRRVVVAASH